MYCTAHVQCNEERSWSCNDVQIRRQAPPRENDVRRCIFRERVANVTQELVHVRRGEQHADLITEPMRTEFIIPNLLYDESALLSVI